MTPNYYRPSGKVSFVGLIAAWLVGTVVAAVGAFVYAVLLVYNPSAYLGVLLPMGYGAAVGGVTAVVGKRLKIRNAGILTAFALVQTMFGYLLSWIPWEWFTFSHLGQEIDVIAVLYPPTFLDLLAAIYENGAWTVGSGSSGSAVSGPALGLVWLIEAGLVVGTCAATAYAVGNSGVFCETCEAWCERTKALFKHQDGSAADLTYHLTNGNYAALGTTPQAGPMAAQWVETELAACGCGVTNALLLEHCVREIDRRGQQRIRRVVLVKHLLITKSEADSVRKTARR